MRHDQYPVEAMSNLLRFEFFSEGPNGKIKKLVAYEPFAENPTLFNLGFGDLSPMGEIDDLVVTNNGDSQKILATVAQTVYRFFDKHPGCFVYATGSTRARIRLYRIGISNNLAEITRDFKIFGLIGDAWEIFEKGKEYEAFLLTKKV